MHYRYGEQGGIRTLVAILKRFCIVFPDKISLSLLSFTLNTLTTLRLALRLFHGQSGGRMKRRFSGSFFILH